jgi:hypothetical protein
MQVRAVSIAVDLGGIISQHLDHLLRAGINRYLGVVKVSLGGHHHHNQDHPSVLHHPICQHWLWLACILRMYYATSDPASGLGLKPLRI